MNHLVRWQKFGDLLDTVVVFDALGAEFMQALAHIERVLINIGAHLAEEEVLQFVELLQVDDVLLGPDLDGLDPSRLFFELFLFALNTQLLLLSSSQYPLSFSDLVVLGEPDVGLALSGLLRKQLSGHADDLVDVEN